MKMPPPRAFRSRKLAISTRKIPSSSSQTQASSSQHASSQLKKRKIDDDWENFLEELNEKDENFD